jgi:uncharacterized repeat protein (TIGR01451 family)
VTPFTQSADITLVKSAGAPTVDQGLNATVTDAGDTITYTFTVENTGNVTLEFLQIADPLLDPPLPNGIVGEIISLAPGAQQVFTATYEITQADMNNGEVLNTAFLNGDGPQGPLPEVPSNPVETPLDQVPGLNVTVRANVSEIQSAQVGNEILYTTVVTNTGNVTLSNVALTDSLGTLNELLITLAPGETLSFVHSPYGLTQADLVAQQVVNTSMGLGSSPGNSDDVTATSSVTIAVMVSLIELIEEQLTQMLEDDMRETTTKQSRIFSDIARGASARLRNQPTGTCVAQLNTFVEANPVLFDTALAVIKPESGPVLDEVAKILATCETGRIEIGGHTDWRGSDAYNMDLSQRRVDSVLRALALRGVDTSRLRARGYGESQPIADNSTDQGMARNRRVMFTNIESEIAQNTAEQCGEVQPFGMNGTLNANDSGMSGNQSFGSESYNCITGERQILTGELSVSQEEGFGVQGMLSATLQREKIFNGDHLRGRFLGGYVSRANIDTEAEGTIDGFGAWAGLYGAKRYQQTLFLDYYLAASAGRHRYDLAFSDLLIDDQDISAGGAYNYWGLFGGAALSGETEWRGIDLTPRAGIDLRYASAWDATVQAQIPGLSETGTLSIDDQKGARLFAELGFGFGDDPEQEGGTDAATHFILTPRLYCDMQYDDASDDLCGFGLNMEYRAEDYVNGTAWGVDLDVETNGDIDRSRAGIFYERALFDESGELSMGADVTQGGQPTLKGNFDIRF